MCHLLKILFVVTLLVSPGYSRAEMSLLMAEEDGCIWCARWDADISEAYPKSPEGQTAPLRRIDIHDAIPSDVVLEKPLFYTPTFVLLENGQEIGRIEGYPGEDFFWGLLGVLLRDAGVSIETSG